MWHSILSQNDCCFNRKEVEETTQASANTLQCQVAMEILNSKANTFDGMSVRRLWFLVESPGDI